jgi:hypothetical protein
MKGHISLDAIWVAVSLLHPEGGVFESRMFNTPKGLVSGYFDKFYDFARALEPWHGKTSIYITLNRLKPELLARARNRFLPFARITTASDDVMARQWFGIDVDSVRARGIPADDAELHAALVRRDEIIHYLVEKGGFPPLLPIMSGSGGWALARVALPNSEEVASVYKEGLHALDQGFSDGAVKVDPAVHSAAQLMKLCSTIAVKGEAIPGRPYRRVVTQGIPLHLIEHPQLVSLDQLRWLAAQNQPDRTYSLPSLSRRADMVTLFKTKGLYLRELSDGKHGVVCPWVNLHTTLGDESSTVIFDASEEYPLGGFKCFHAHCAGRSVKDVLAKLGVSGTDAFLSLEGRVGHEKQFRAVALSTFLVEPQDPIVWVVGNYIPEGALVVLASYPKVGKTTWIFALIVAVATGKTFMGFATCQGPVLLLSVEEHRREVKARLLRFGARPDAAIYVHAAPLDHDANVFSRIAAFIREHQIRLVVLDTLGSFWQISDENNNAEVERRLRPWRDLAHVTNCAVVLIHHERKIKGSGGREIRGGSALLGGVDQALLLDHRRGGSRSQRVLRATGRYDDTPKELILELVGNDYAALGTADELSGEAVVDTVASALSGEWQGIPAIATVTRMHGGQVRRALETLRKRGQAERAGAGKKGDPYTYRRRPDAFRPQGQPRGKKSKSNSTERI